MAAHERDRVDAFAVGDDFEVEVVAGAGAGGALEPELLSDGDGCAGSDGGVDAGEMRVAGLDASGVLEVDDVAVAGGVPAGPDDAASGRGDDGAGPGLGGHVLPAVEVHAFEYGVVAPADAAGRHGVGLHERRPPRAGSGHRSPARPDHGGGRRPRGTGNHERCEQRGAHDSDDERCDGQDLAHAQAPQPAVSMHDGSYRGSGDVIRVRAGGGGCWARRDFLIIGRLS